MKLRTFLALFAVVAIAACGGAAEEPAAVPEEVPMDDAAAIAALADEYVVHYNLHHPSMVNDYYTGEGIGLPADGSVLMGAEARLAHLEAAMEGNPTLAVETADVAVFGDTAVAHGSYSVEIAPEGADAMSVTGNWMASYEKADGDWKIAVLLSNYDGDPPEDLPDPTTPAEPPPEQEDSPLAELLGYYATHFNMGHGGMVASRYTEDAMAAFAGGPKLEGRAAIEEDLNARIEELGNPQLTIHVVAGDEVGDDFVFGGGRYEMAAEAGDSQGAFLILAKRGDDGNLQIQWAVSNGLPVNQ
ncbi:MAG: SgcJ/EcaC family oxidoreductase [Acidobacteria bacterium]|nr:SgcJ/EcaC family oxidoreductase [Acidobacteriota bacterium]